jgi:glycerate-2-kinase
VALAVGTGGIDGSTDAAGGFGDGETIERGRKAGVDAVAAFDANDSGRFMKATSERVVTGPTGTNVGDLVLAMRSAPYI